MMAQNKWQDISGVLLLDKTVGVSSNDALQKARRIFRARKGGHAGTLDPLASGLLLCAFGHATKFINDLIDSDKTYVATIRLGEVSDTGDGEGQITPTDPEHLVEKLDTETLIAALATLTGRIEQQPPMYSALKHKGKPLYEYARKGQEIERPTRAITIHQMDLLEQALPDITVRVACSKGTYIRVLAEDIGKALGCGAYLVGLRRETVAGFHIDNASTLDSLAALAEQDLPTKLAPVDTMVSGLPACEIVDDQVELFLHGQSVLLEQCKPLTHADDSDDANSRCRVYDGDRFLGIAITDGQKLAPKRLVAGRN